MQYTLPKLGYDYDALEPYIDASTMQIHYGKHHQAYISNLNTALEGSDQAERSLEELFTHIDNVPPAVRNNGGGHWNHTFFWESIAPPTEATQTISTELQQALKSIFGDLEACKEAFNKAAMQRFGSGWAWIILQNGKLHITSTPNQDNPLMSVANERGTPLLGVDVWEHAYYLKYQNKRVDYLNAFWSVVNWSVVSKRFARKF